MKNLLLIGLAGLALYTLMQPAKPQYDETRVNEILAAMRADPMWLDAITAKAAANGVSLEDQMLADAIWMLSQPA